MINVPNTRRREKKMFEVKKTVTLSSSDSKSALKRVVKSITVRICARAMAVGARAQGAPAARPPQRSRRAGGSASDS